MAWLENLVLLQENHEIQCLGINIGSHHAMETYSLTKQWLLTVSLKTYNTANVTINSDQQPSITPLWVPLAEFIIYSQYWYIVRIFVT